MQEEDVELFEERVVIPERYFRSRIVRRERRRLLPDSVGLMVALSLIAASIYLATNPSTVSSSQASTSDVSLNPAVRSAAFSNPDVYCRMPNPTNFLRSNNRAWLILLIPLIIFCFSGLALVTDDYFVPSLERLCQSLQLSEDVAGATFMAAGSSAPELFTALVATFRTKDDVGIGTIVGSAAFNILVIIGASAVVATGAPRLDWRPFMRDTLFYVVSVALLLVFVLGSGKGNIVWWEALILVLVYVLYCLFMKFANARYMQYTEKYVARDELDSTSTNSTPEPTSPAAAQSDSVNVGPFDPEENSRDMDLSHFESTRSDYVDDYDPEPIFQRPSGVLGWIGLPFLLPWRIIFRFSIPDVRHQRLAKWWPATFTISVVWVMAITFVMVEMATLAGCYIGVPSAIMGLIVLAAGTSIPDALASVSVARKGRGDMAVSNAIGSNVFDILLGLGLPWLLGAIIHGNPVAVTASPANLVVVPISILIVIIAVLIAILSVTGWRLSKKLGFTLFTVYSIFVGWILLNHYVFKLGVK